MRNCLFIALLIVAGAAGAVEIKGGGFVNNKVSSRTIAFNQPVRVEFTTMPRQVEAVDIAATVGHALEVGSVVDSWRQLGRPVVNEHEKTKTVNVIITLLPRVTGQLSLPSIPMSWLSGEQIAEFGQVMVNPNLQVGSETRELPKEVSEVAGYPWGCKFADVQGKFPVDGIKQEKDFISVRPQNGLELIFRGGELAEAVLLAPGLGLEQARDSFLNRWGLPQIEDNGPLPQISWLLGWTRINATTQLTAVAGQGNRTDTKLHLLREDIQARLNHGKVQAQVFGILDGPKDAPETVDQAAERRKQDAINEAARPAIPDPKLAPK